MIVNIKVVAGAKKNLIKKENDYLKVYVCQPAVEGKANKALLELLSEYFRVKKDKCQNTEVYYFTKKDNINKNRLVQEFNADNLEMFFADKVIVVEGVSDRILIRGLIDKFYYGDKEIKVVSVSGKNNIDIYMRLMEIFKIPYLILLDVDALYGLGVGAIRKYLSVGHIKPLKKVHHSRHHKRSMSRHGRQQLSGPALRQIEELKKHCIYILPNGTIEDNYPKRYQRRDTKPLNALYAASQITEDDFYSPTMANLREIIEAL